MWTEKGHTVHVTRQYDEALTYCGRGAFGPVDAFDVWWYSTCERCRKAVLAEEGQE